MKKAFVCLLFASMLLLVVSCNGDVGNTNGANGSFPSWLEGKTLKVMGNASKAVLMEEDDYFYVTCSGTSVYVDDRQSGDMASYGEEANVVNDGNTVVASTSTTQYVFVSQEDGISLEIKGNESLDGIYSTETMPKPQYWPLVIKCYEGPNQTDNVAVRIVVTPRGLYYLLCSNYDMYKNGKDPFQCEKDVWFVFVEDIEISTEGFSLSNSRGSFVFSYGKDGSITLVNAENTFVLKEKSFDYKDLIKNAECVGGASHVHNYVVKERVEPTCKDGYERKECECGASYEEVLPATGEHDYVLVKQIKNHINNDSTSGNGTGLYRCSVCGDEKEQVIAHEYEQIEDPKFPKGSYFKNGKYCRKCKLCGYIDRTNAEIIYRDTIKFGSYKGEPIEWLVLKTAEDGSALLWSKYILFDSKYANGEYGKNEKFTDSDRWSNNPYIKTLLNGGFYEQSFSDKEKDLIKDSGLGKVFLIARSEFGNYTYFDYYDSRGRYKDDNSAWYWLLDFNVEGSSPYQAKSWNNDEIKAIYERDDKAGVRPCIWVSNWESSSKE